VRVIDKDYYKVLGVSKAATGGKITHAYRKLAKQYHPDANPGKEDLFKDLSAAYEVLGDPAKRAEYDLVWSMDASGEPASTGQSRTRAEDLGDLIGGLFNRGNRHHDGNRSPVRGSDLEAEAHISFEDAANGTTVTLDVCSNVACGSCHGDGSAAGTSPAACGRCQGTGSVSDNQGFFAFSLPCPDCGGRGIHIEKVCSDCGGIGVESKRRRIRVRISRGVDDGARMRLGGKGGAGINGGEPGDLYVTVHVAPHKIFSRQGVDLGLTVPITFAEAALGATITVPTMDGQVSLRIPPGARSGLVLRARSKGLAKRQRSHWSERTAGMKRTEDRGDLLVTLEIDVPTHLNEGQHRAVEDYAKVTESPRGYSEVEANAER